MDTKDTKEISATMAKDNLSMTLNMMMAGRDEVAEVCFKRVIAYLDKQIELEASEVGRGWSNDT